MDYNYDRVYAAPPDGLARAIAAHTDETPEDIHAYLHMEYLAEPVPRAHAQFRAQLRQSPEIAAIIRQMA